MARPGAQCTLYLVRRQRRRLLFFFSFVFGHYDPSPALVHQPASPCYKGGITDSLSYSPIKFYTAAAIVSREILRYSPRHRETSSVPMPRSYNSGSGDRGNDKNLQRLYFVRGNDSTLQRRTAATTIRKREPTSTLARPALPARPALLASNLRCQPGLRC